MAKRIFVTATNTNVGKTHTTLALMQEAFTKGLRPAALKPIETGVSNGIPSDGTLLLEATHRFNPYSTEIGMDDIVPFKFELPAAPFVAKGSKTICMESIMEKLERLESICDILFIEGAGGVMVPVEEEVFMIDLANIFEAHTLLVSPSRLGSISETLSSIQVIRDRSLKFDLAINVFEEKESFKKVTLPYYLQSRTKHFLLPEESEKLFEKLIS